MPKKTEEKALITQAASFDLTTPGDGIEIDPEIAAEITDEDTKGYETPTDTLPIVSIRQKDLLDKNSGKVMAPAGGFKMYDSITDSDGGNILDVNAEVGLHLTVLSDQTSRVLWGKFGESDKPLCKAIDGQNGMGSPAGQCRYCPMSQWINGDRPQCTEQRNLLVYDHGMKGCYVLRLGRSALRPYNNFKTLLKRKSTDGHTIPLHAVTMKLTAEYEAEPAPHYVPRFVVVDTLGIEIFKQMKSHRAELTHNFSSTVQIDTSDDEHLQTDNEKVSAHEQHGGPVGEPKGSGPVSTGTDEDLPF
jgi:hypothetical protein